MSIKVIIGLGNPDPQYENTYHNVGILALEKLKEDLKKDITTTDWKRHKDLFKYVETKDLVLVKCLTYMNESGVAAREAMRKFKAAPEEIAVIHDDSDIALGDVKFAMGRNSAGHKGVQSIIDSFHSKNFLRVRIGIRDKNERKRKKASEFVLAQIKKKDRDTLDAVFEKIAKELFERERH